MTRRLAMIALVRPMRLVNGHTQRMECGCCICTLSKYCVATKRNDARNDMTRDATAFELCCTRASFVPIYRDTLLPLTRRPLWSVSRISYTHQRTSVSIEWHRGFENREHTHFASFSIDKSTLRSHLRAAICARFAAMRGIAAPICIRFYHRLQLVPFGY